ncbi:hypothetical protein [uncultured Clostridium sp.]|uniref:hypothetical protein n=1 Tax=uncultured Clostridium sp. TaxID=59620 RepID=UPI0028E7C84C|nr:hypothetical protein [uncultured Clostridium sp.]
MKSSDADLRKRGFITTEDINEFQQCSNSELILLINSPNSIERSAAINLLSNRFYIEDLDFVKILLERLCIEKCLYTKIEICNALQKGGIKTAEQMLHYLGRIGKNQHLCLPEKVSKKKSYPLPRDIIARTLGKMDCRILPVLFDVLKSNNQEKISEVIDAIGFSLFYNSNYDNEYFFKSIIDTLNKYLENDLIFWKCVICLSSFRTQGSIEALNQILNSNKNDIIKCETKRSIKLIGENYEL